MPFPLDIFTAQFTAALGPSFLPVPMGGHFVHCTEANHPFAVSIDGSPRVPFGAGQFLAPKNPDGTPLRFERLELYPLAGFVDNTIKLMIGNVDYRGGLGIAAGQYIRPESAARIVSQNFVFPNPAAFAPNNWAPFGIRPRQYMVNVRNTSAANSILLAAPGGPELQAGEGYILAAGENVDLSVKESVPIAVKAAENDTFTITWFCYA